MLQRFSLYEDEDHVVQMHLSCNRVYPDKDGNWCLWGDTRKLENKYKELEAKYKAATEEIAYCKNNCIKNADKAQVLEFENSRLKKELEEAKKVAQA